MYVEQVLWEESCVVTDGSMRVFTNVLTYISEAHRDKYSLIQLWMIGYWRYEYISNK